MLCLFLVSLLCWQIFTVDCNGDMGPGVWRVSFIENCEANNQVVNFEVSKNKINRTHDGFNARLTLEEPFDETFGIRCDVCKIVDGGCKSFQVLSDNCLIEFVNKYVKNNVRSCLERIGADPPEFPLKAGEYQLDDYIIDYSELPEDGPYGKFCASCFVLKGPAEMGCVKVYVDFSEDTESEEGDEK